MTDAEPLKTTAYRLESRRLVMRCWSPTDAPMLRAALDRNDEHLRPWIPFMKDEPRSLYETAEWLRGHRATFDLGQNFRFAVFDEIEENLLGENMLLGRAGPGAFEIGYWTDKNSIGKGYAQETTCSMIRMAFEIEQVERVEIMCDPRNRASTLIPERLGFTHDATLRQRALDSEGNKCDLMVWSLFDTDYPSTPAAASDFRAFDCMGEVIEYPRKAG